MLCAIEQRLTRAPVSSTNYYVIDVGWSWAAFRRFIFLELALLPVLIRFVQSSRSSYSRAGFFLQFWQKLKSEFETSPKWKTNKCFCVTIRFMFRALIWLCIHIEPIYYFVCRVCTEWQLPGLFHWTILIRMFFRYSKSSTCFITKEWRWTRRCFLTFTALLRIVEGDLFYFDYKWGDIYSFILSWTGNCNLLLPSFVQCGLGMDFFHNNHLSATHNQSHSQPNLPYHSQYIDRMAPFVLYNEK